MAEARDSNDDADFNTSELGTKEQFVFYNKPVVQCGFAFEGENLKSNLMSEIIEKYITNMDFNLSLQSHVDTLLV